MSSLKPTCESVSTMLTPAAVLAGVLILAGGQSRRMGSPKALKKLPTGVTLLEHHVHQALSLDVPIWIADNQQGFMVDERLVAQAKQLGVQIKHIADYLTQHNHRTPYRTSEQTHQGAGPLAAILSGLQHAIQHTATDTANSNINKSDTKAARNGQGHLLVVSCDSLITAACLWALLTSQPLDEQSKSSKHVPQSNPQLTQSFIHCLIAHQAGNTQHHVQNQSKPVANRQQSYPLLGMYHVSLIKALQAYLAAGNRRVMQFITQTSNAVHTAHADMAPVRWSLMPKAWQPLANLNTPEQFITACHLLDKRLSPPLLSATV